jgi:tetratricopeptide (TPR) repeat protein
MDYLGNARRVQGDLASADEAFAQARRLWPAGEADPCGLLAQARSFDLEASLRSEQGRFVKALDLLDRALAASRETEEIARLLIKKAGVLEFSGDDAGALAVLREAAPRVSRESDPRQYFALRFNLATTLCHLGRHAEVEPALAEIRALAAQLGKRLDQVRVRWLEGRVAAGLGRVEEAAAALEEVREALAARGIAFDTAQVSLELSALYLEQGRTARVRELAAEAVAVFARQDNHREAVAALQLFLAAVEKDRATAALARRLFAYLRRAQHDPALRFEP